MKVRLCELCPSNAVVFCPSDAAFLCRSCDVDIHSANFLVARHVRQPICSTCHQLACSSCSDDDAVSSVCNSSSSSTTSRRRRSNSTYKAEGIFVNWCGKLGIGSEIDSAVQMACKGLKVCSERWTVLPFRVSLAASMWLGLKLGVGKPVLTWKVLKRLEEISGVPAKLILTAGSKLERALSKENDYRRRIDLEEGWAES